MDWFNYLNPICFDTFWITLLIARNMTPAECASLFEVWVYGASVTPKDVLLPREGVSEYVIMTWSWVKLISGQVWNTNLHDLLFTPADAHIKHAKAQIYTAEGFACHARGRESVCLCVYCKSQWYDSHVNCLRACEPNFSRNLIYARFIFYAMDISDITCLCLKQF